MTTTHPIREASAARLSDFGFRASSFAGRHLAQRSADDLVNEITIKNFFRVNFCELL